jgi:hypothetical protein
MTLHEIGHVVYSEKPVEVFYRAFKESQLRAQTSNGFASKVLYSLYTIPLVWSCLLHDLNHTGNGLKVEIEADAMTVKYGYGGHLSSALEKIIRSMGTDNSYTDKAGNDAKVAAQMNWCSLVTRDLVKRKNTLKDTLYYQTVRTNSPFVQQLAVKLLNTLGLQLKERYNGKATEATVELLCQDDFLKNYRMDFDPAILGVFEGGVLSEFNSRSKTVAMEAYKPPKPPSQKDLDRIAIEIDKITNQFDRSFCLDLIYDEMKRLTAFSEQMIKDPQLERKYGHVVDSMYRELESYRQAVLKKRLQNTGFRLVVGYPEGYEG